MMRTSAAALVGALCFVMWPALAGARTETVTGKVVDLFCYDPPSGANSGMDHKAVGAADQEGRECAWACARWEGQPVGVLTADGKLYQLAGGLVADNNAKIAPHVTHTVTITGDVTEKDGIQVLTANDLKMVSK
jgi:hypothetical protein